MLIMLPLTVYLICNQSTTPSSLQGFIRYYRKLLGAINLVACIPIGSKQLIHVGMADGCSIYPYDASTKGPVELKNTIWRSKKTPGWCLLTDGCLAISTAEVEREEQRGTTIARTPAGTYLFRQDLLRDINIAADESKVVPIGKIVWSETAYSYQDT